MMDLGTLAHKLMLGKGAEVQVIDAKDWRTKSAQTERDAARLAGRIPILAKDAEAAPAIADSWKRNLLEHHGIVIPELTEVTLLWDYIGTQCRCRVDAIDVENSIIYDLKRTTIAHNSRKIEAHFDSFNYAIQSSAYIQAAEANYGHVGKWRFIFIALEPDEPYCATPIEGDESFLQLGRMRWDRAASEWAKCLAREKWPPPSAINIAARPYSLTNEAEKTYIDEL